MTNGPGLQRPQSPRSAAPHEVSTRDSDGRQQAKAVDVRESGIVPARTRALHQGMPCAVSLTPSRDGISEFGAAVASAGDMLLVGGRMRDGEHGSAPFATMYRVTSEGVVRERLLRGSLAHGGPSISTDGLRVAVGQPAPEGGLGFVSVYRRRETELELEATLELKPDDPACASFGQLVAIDRDLLVLGQPASVSVYRHSAVGWLAAGTPRPALPYEWNPRFGLSCAVSAGRVLVGNPVEIDGHRAGPGRVFVYRRDGDQLELESELSGDGIEGGREAEPRLGFGASIHTAGEFVLISAPYELSASGAAQSRVYVYRVLAGALTRVAALEVPSCRTMCLAGERLFVLGEALHVYTRRGNSFEELASYPVDDYARASATMSVCGQLLVLGYPVGPDEGDTGEVALHFTEQF
ncbi:MAG: hypothetical protein JWN04_1166 [Myxococcaceae bacterium]|nr:hypothetical protein [Myxococcaceae bacterium]